MYERYFYNFRMGCTDCFMLSGLRRICLQLQAERGTEAGQHLQVRGLRSGASRGDRFNDCAAASA